MHLTFICPECQHSQRSPSLAGVSELCCASCGWRRPLVVPEAKGQGRAPRECLRCGNPDLWRQKNFPQWLGLAIVGLGAVASSVAWSRHEPILALGILMGFALVDMVLYVTMPDVLVCYRCRTKHHAADVSAHAGFSHELAERYRQERLRQAGFAGQSDRADPTAPLAHG